MYKRLLVLMVTLTLLFTGCSGSKYEPVYTAELTDGLTLEINVWGEPLPLYATVGDMIDNGWVARGETIDRLNKQPPGVWIWSAELAINDSKRTFNFDNDVKKVINAPLTDVTLYSDIDELLINDTDILKLPESDLDLFMSNLSDEIGGNYTHVRHGLADHFAPEPICYTNDHSVSYLFDKLDVEVWLDADGNNLGARVDLPLRED